MLFFVFLSLLAITVPLFSWRAIASCASRLCRSHLGDSILVNLDHPAARICAAREAFEALWTPRDDRVGVGARLDRVALFDLLVEKDIEAVLACPEGVDLSHQCEYGKAGLLRDAAARAAAVPRESRVESYARNGVTRSSGSLARTA